LNHRSHPWNSWIFPPISWRGILGSFAANKSASTGLEVGDSVTLFGGSSFFIYFFFFFLILFYSSIFNVMMFGLVVDCVVGFCRLGPLQIFEPFGGHQNLDL